MKIDLQGTEVGNFDYELRRGLVGCEWGAAEFGECTAAAALIRPGDMRSWIASWHGLGQNLADQARSADLQGHQVSARNLLLRASTYMRMAAFYASYENPLHRQCWAASREFFHGALPQLPQTVEAIRIPFGKALLPGYFVNSGHNGAPTLIAIGGFDSTAEELYGWIGRAAPAYGWNCLIFEGPGQWGALYDNPGLHLRPDYEAPLAAVIDWADQRPEIRPDRLALIGYSLGGCLAPRAAAFEARIGAVIANSLVVDVGEAFRAAWPSFLRAAPPSLFNAAFGAAAAFSVAARWGIQHARWAMGIRQPYDFLMAWRDYSLIGLEDRMRCPMLLLFGEDEIAQTSAQLILQTIRFIAKVPARRRIHLFTRGDGAAPHCQIGGLYLAQAAIFDWLDGIFGRRPLPPPCDLPLSFNRPLAPWVRKYHGRAAGDAVAALTEARAQQASAPHI